MALGYSFLMMLKLDQYKKEWYHDSDGDRVCVSIRRAGLQFPLEETSPADCP